MTDKQQEEIELKEFLFYIEGLNREVWFKERTEGLARAGVWQSLTDEEQDAVAQIECIDERSVK